jgi:hypothetical protein
MSTPAPKQEATPAPFLIDDSAKERDLWMLIGKDAPTTQCLDSINFVSYAQFLSELDALEREGYETDSMPFIDLRSLPSEEELEGRTHTALDRERRLLAYAISRCCVEFLYYNRYFHGSRHAEIMSEQIGSLGPLHTRIAKLLPKMQIRELAAGLKVDLPPTLNVEALEDVV